MKNMIQAAVVTLFAASAAHAQQAVQWKVSDGGNGHWYQLKSAPLQSWSNCVTQADAAGGHLVTLTSSQENEFVVTGLAGSATRYPWIGLSQSPDANEPSGGWTWITGEPLTWSNWSPSEPNGDGAFDADQANLWMIGDVDQGRPRGKWNDWHTGGPDGFIVEWDADCNGDGIVDYGQCHDGTLPDYNGNNIPDCCERGEACVVGNYPLQWRVAEGGNGHWYQWRGWGIEPTFDGATAQAMQLGGHLATVVSDAEAAAVLSIVSDDSCEPQYGGAIWLGARQQPGQTSPGSGWSWVTAEPWSYERWRSGEPNDFQGVQEDRLVFSKIGGHWLDVPDHPVFSPPCVFGLLVEWDADCNNDGIVDYGQILQATLADANGNGVPDICELPTCHNADLYRNNRIDGADLGILLSEWGPVTPSTNSDINKDGFVNGADLGVMLAFWGPCSN